MERKQESIAMDAVYEQTDPENKGSKKYIKPLLTILVLVLLLVTIYLQLVKVGCRLATQTLFEYGRTLDISDTVEKFPSKYKFVAEKILDDEIKEQLDARKMIKEKVKETMEEKGVTLLVSEDLVDTCVDRIIDDAVSEADFEILDVKSGLTSCRVTLRTSNVDYLALSDQMFSSLKEDGSDLISSMFHNAGGFIQNIIGQIFGSSKQSSKAIAESVWKSVEEYYLKEKDKAERKEYVGEIRYHLSGAKWTLDSVDSELISAFYGVSLEQLDIDLNELGIEGVEFK